MSLVTSTILILAHVVMASLTLIILWIICDYIRKKPETMKSLLDGATLHAFEYLALATLCCLLTQMSLEVSNQNIKSVWVQINGWALLFAMQLFYLELIVCAVVKFCLVFHLELPEVKDEIVHLCVRLILICNVTIILIGLWFGFGYKHLIFTTQFTAQNFVGPILSILALGSQCLSRLITYYKIGKVDESMEIIKTKTFVLVFVLHLPFRIIGIFIPIDTQTIIFITQYLILTFSFGTLYFSPNLCNFIEQKYHCKNLMNQKWTKLRQRFIIVITFWHRFHSVEPMVEPNG